MAIYHLNHRPVGKTTHAPGTAAAAVRYLTRRSACERIDSVGGVPNNPHALEREAHRQEELSRKNARICDKFVIALPREMAMEQRVALTRAFLVRLTQNGRARAFACYHGQDTANPHIHIMFFDRDSETGKRVQRTSEKGSTQRIRIMWEETCNAHLEREGFTARIDHRSLYAIEQEREADALRDALQFDEPEDEMVEQENEAPAAPVVDHLDTPFAARTPMAKIGHILSMDAELHDLERTLRDYAMLKERQPKQRDAFDHHSQASTLAAGEAALAVKRYAEALAEFQRDHQRRSGHLQGSEIKIAGMTVYRSRAREQALLKQEELRLARDAMESAKQAAEFHKHARESAGRKLRETNERMTPIRDLMKTYGTEQEAQALASNLRQSRDFGLDCLEPDEIEKMSREEGITPEQRERLYGLKLERKLELEREHQAGSDGLAH